jgi:hypothetical protein
MSLASRGLALLIYAAAGVAAIALVPSAAADPDIHTESATAVIADLQKQGYTVEINGVPSGDTSLLTNCTVTEIHNPGNATPDPAVTTTVYVDVACPIQRG